MKTFIANFGVENYLWPKCLARPSVAILEAEDLRPLWLAGDRNAYIAHCLATKLNPAGIPPTKHVASRWFNLPGIVSSTEGDLWIHREKDELWWTFSLAGNVEVLLEPAFKPTQQGKQVYVIHKPTDTWSSKSKNGNRLEWRALHAKARDFLFTEGTLQALGADHAAYALALINGGDLSGWHSRSEWKARAEAARGSSVTIFSAKQRAVARMAMTAHNTVTGANGQQVLRTVKEKELRFAARQEFEKYITELLSAQEGLCAITGLQLQFDGENEEPALLCSLDRIDSNGHYEAGNLQVVCQFINRWKSDGDDTEFRRLIRIVRDTDALD